MRFQYKNVAKRCSRRPNVYNFIFLYNPNMLWVLFTIFKLHLGMSILYLYLFIWLRHSPLLSGTRWVKSLCWNPSSASLRNCWYWWSGSGHLTPRWGEYCLRKFLIKEGFRLWKLYSFFCSVVGHFVITILLVTNSVLNIFFCIPGVIDLHMLGCFGIFVNSTMCQFSVF